MNVAEPNMPSLKGLRVLIVEDEPIIAMCLGELIVDEGCVLVGTAETVAKALLMAKTEDFDVALLDLNLHGETVAPVASAVLERGGAIVFSTGALASEVPVAFKAWPVLCKPYQDEDVLVALATAVHARNTPVA